ncbi:hypothetical protein E2C01_027281 [Portunus trituberculatus]|uniref:Uncharacterized protein n=1 Tax=Portunus trituberculatus TaxID=210409 RepID=A0A5B7EIB8_PORTR|nr:hypothetical protein [Portunus trituberculatus]
MISCSTTPETLSCTRQGTPSKPDLSLLECLAVSVGLHVTTAVEGLIAESVAETAREFLRDRGCTHPATEGSRSTGTLCATTRCLPAHHNCFTISQCTMDRRQCGTLIFCLVDGSRSSQASGRVRRGTPPLAE